MITSIHQYLKKNAKEGLGTVILCSLVIGGLVGLPALFQKNQHDAWAIRVNNIEIPYKNFLQEVSSYQELIKSLKNSYGDLAYYLLASMGFGTNPQQIALEKLIRQAIVDQIGHEIGVTISQEYVNQKIHDKKFMQNFVSDKAFNTDGSLNMDIIRKELNYQGSSVANFESLLLQGITRDFVIKMLQMSCPLAHFETSYQHEMQDAVRDIMIVELPFKEFLEKEKKHKISEAEVLEYFNRHNRLSRRYWSVETRSGNLFKVEKSSYPISITDEEMSNYYEKNKTKKYIKSPAQVVVEEIRESDLVGTGLTLQSIKNGKNHKVSWKKIDPFSRATHEPVYERAAFKLKNSGDISEIITLSDGSKLMLKLVKYVKREYKTLSEVKDEIRNELSDQKFKKQFISEVNDLIKQGKINNFIKSKSVKKSKLGYVTKDDKNTGVSELFSLKNKGDKKAFINQNNGYVVILTSLLSSAEQPFLSIKETVLSDIYAEKARVTMEEMFKNLRESFKQTSSVAEWISQHNAKILFEGLVDPKKEEHIKNIEKYDLSLRMLSSLDKAPAVSLIDLEKGSFVYLKSVILSNNVDDSEQKITEKETIRQEKEAQGLNAIVASFYRNATIETNQLIMAIEPEE